jgi:hypothetical protein
VLYEQVALWNAACTLICFNLFTTVFQLIRSSLCDSVRDCRPTVRLVQTVDGEAGGSTAEV